MVRWWAAFFISGLVAPPGPGVERGASLISAVLALWAVARPGEPSWGHDGGAGRRRYTGAVAAFTLTCAAAVIIWSAAGIERAAETRGESPRRVESSVARDAGAQRGARDHALTSAASSGIRSFSLSGARSRLLGRLDDGRLSKRARGIVGALILDDRSGLDFTLSETYSYVGITHFLALSGLHLGAIAIPLSKIFSRLLRSRRASDTALLASLCVYSAVAGFPASLLRALFLSAAVIAFRFLGIHTDLMGALVTGSFALVAVDPSVAFDAGFQLSFAAVCGIALVGIPVSRMVEPLVPGGASGRVLKALLFPALITCSVQFLTLPLVISLFKRSSLLSPVVNVIVSFPFTLLLYAGVLYVFVPVSLFRAVLAPPVNLLCGFLGAVPAAFSHGPHAALYRGDFSIDVYACGVVLVAWSLRKSCARKRTAVCAGAACVLLSFLLSSFPGARLRGPIPGGAAPPAATEASAGSGSLYVPAGEGVIFVGERFGPGESYRLTRELWARGVRRVGCCVVTPSRLGRRHGLYYLVTRVTIDELICSPYLLAGNAGFKDRLGGRFRVVRAVARGDTVRGRLWRLEITGPVYPPPADARVSRAGADLAWRLFVRDSVGGTWSVGSGSGAGAVRSDRRSGD